MAANEFDVENGLDLFKDDTLSESQVMDNLIFDILNIEPNVGRFRKRNTASELIALTKKKRNNASHRSRNTTRNVGRRKKNGAARNPRKKQTKVSQIIFKEESSKPSRTSFVRRKTSRRRIINPDCKILGSFEKKLPWTLAALALHMKSNEAALEFCQKKSLLPNTKQCPICKEVVVICPEKLSCDEGLDYVFRCSQATCQVTHAAGSDTWFEKSKLPIQKSLLLTYCFATNFPFNLAVHESSFTGGCTSPATVSDWYSYCREVCVDAMTRQMAEKVGGPMCIVEMDEAKVGERQVGQKAFRGQSVLGFYCRVTKKVSLVCVPNTKCEASTLTQIIEEHVNEGSTVIVDCWDPEEMLGPGYHHLITNCELKFIAPDCGLRNTGIEKIWRHLKTSFPQAENYKKAYHLNEYLCEFLWRRWVDVCMLDPFEAFLHDASMLCTSPSDEELS